MPIILHRGDVLVLNGAEITASQTVCLDTGNPVEKRVPSGLSDLPETPLRVRQLWSDRRGPRAAMTARNDLRCPCGSVYVRQSQTHLSCLYCGRAWALGDLPEALLVGAPASYQAGGA